MNDNRKTLIMEALRAFVAQRPGFDTGNYDRAGYRSDSRRVTQQRHDFERLALSVETLDEITADDLVAAFPRAFSGRLSIEACPHGDSARTTCGDGHVWCGDCEPAPSALCPVCHGGNAHPLKPNEVRLDYCTGQYWCTEYRAAACAVLASALWDCQRKSLPINEHGKPYETYGPKPGGGLMSAGDRLRNSFRNWYGRGIQSRWFN